MTVAVTASAASASDQFAIQYQEVPEGGDHLSMSQCRRLARYGFYHALTTRVHHHLMMTRDDKSAVILRLRKRHGLLADFLEAALKIDHQRMVIGEMPKLVAPDSGQASTAPQLPQVAPSSISPFAFRRANLVTLAKCRPEF
jgi:hypothetical protein